MHRTQGCNQSSHIPALALGFALGAILSALQGYWLLKQTTAVDMCDLPKRGSAGYKAGGSICKRQGTCTSPTNAPGPKLKTDMPVA